MDVLNVAVDGLEGFEQILEFQRLDVVVSLDDIGGDFVDVLNADLEFRNVVNGGEHGVVEAVSNGNNDVVV